MGCEYRNQVSRNRAIGCVSTGFTTKYGKYFRKHAFIHYEFRILSTFLEFKRTEKRAEMHTRDRSPRVLVHEQDLTKIRLLSRMWKPRTARRSASPKRHQGKTGLEWIHAK